MPQGLEPQPHLPKLTVVPALLQTKAEKALEQIRASYKIGLGKHLLADDRAIESLCNVRRLIGKPTLRWTPHGHLPPFASHGPSTDPDPSQAKGTCSGSGDSVHFHLLCDIGILTVSLSASRSRGKGAGSATASVISSPPSAPKTNSSSTTGSVA